MTAPEWALESIKVYEFHRDKLKEHGQTAAGRPMSTEQNTWSIRDTARELNLSKSKCHNLLIIGKALKKDYTLKYHSYTVALRLARKHA